MAADLLTNVVRIRPLTKNVWEALDARDCLVAKLPASTVELLRKRHPALLISSTDPKFYRMEADHTDYGRVSWVARGMPDPDGTYSLYTPGKMSGVTEVALLTGAIAEAREENYQSKKRDYLLRGGEKTLADLPTPSEEDLGFLSHVNNVNNRYLKPSPSEKASLMRMLEDLDVV